MNELKPCPHCGKEQDISMKNEYLPYNGSWRTCDHCEIEIPDWNTRPIEDALRAELEKRTAELHYANTVCMEMKHELDRLKEENHALDQINRDIQTAAAHLDEVLAELARRDEELALTEKKLCNIDRSARVEVARRDEIIARLKEDGERLASNVTTVIDEDGHLWCNACKNYDIHTEYCPITLHRALMKELE